MVTPDALERSWTLTTAVARFEELRTRDCLAGATGQADQDADLPPGDGVPTRPLSCVEALELLALSEVIARKAGYGRQLVVRTARSGGASWAQIGRAMGTSRQAAWEAHTRWINGQAGQYDATGYEGLDEKEAAAARALAGTDEQ